MAKGKGEFIFINRFFNCYKDVNILEGNNFLPAKFKGMNLRIFFDRLTDALNQPVKEIVVPDTSLYRFISWRAWVTSTSMDNALRCFISEVGTSTVIIKIRAG